jgi:hypothetical protein
MHLVSPKLSFVIHRSHPVYSFHSGGGKVLKIILEVGHHLIVYSDEAFL